MPANGNPCGVDDAALIEGLDGSGGISHQLPAETVIRFGIAFAHNRKGRIIEHRKTLGHPKNGAAVVGVGEGIGVAGRLACTLCVFVFNWVGPKQQWEPRA